MTQRDLCRLRLAAQHLLAPVAPLAAAGDLCGLQAQFLSAALHALRIRSTHVSTDGLVKSWTHRDTMHLFPEADLPLYFRRQGDPDAVTESAWYHWCQGKGQALNPERERFFARMVAEAIAQGCDTRDALRQLCREQGMTDAEETRLFHPWGGIMAELAQCGVICFKVQEEKAYRLCPAFTPLPAHAAEIELARRYFTHYGPTTLRDAAYFFGVPQSRIKLWLKELPVHTFTLEGRTYFHLPSEVPQAEIPPVLLLAGFDQLMLGYRKEDNPFLPPEHLRGIFNLAGIVAPAILLDGRVAGKWKYGSGKLTLTLFDSITPDAKRAVLDKAESLWPVKTVQWL